MWFHDTITCVLIVTFILQMLAVTILGNNSALPAYDRHPTSKLVTLETICSWLTAAKAHRFSFQNTGSGGGASITSLSHICTATTTWSSGFLSSMGLLQREQELHLFAPAPLQEILDLQFKAAIPFCHTNYISSTR